MKIDYQNNDYDFLLSYYGAKEAYPIIEKAAQNGFFKALDDNMPVSYIKKRLSADETEAELLLDILEQCGFVVRGNDYLCAAPVASKYLTSGSFLTSEKENCFIENKLKKFYPESAEISVKCFESVPETIPSDNEIFAFVGIYEKDHSLAASISVYREWQETGICKAFSVDSVKSFCKKNQLVYTPLLTVTDGISVVFAAKTAELLDTLELTTEDRLIAELKKLAIRSVTMIDPKDVVTSSWVRDHCRFGCSTYGDKHCPPHSPTYDETWTKLEEYKHALLIEGEPPTHSFQHLMLKAEKTAFKAGYYRAFAYWAGPCSLCTECKPPDPPKKCTASRPSMESAGIDVFATVRKQGFQMETRKDKNEFVKYFGLLLLD